MHQRYLLGLLLIILMVSFVPDLFADQAKQEKLEAAFCAEYKFDGIITWWNDDTPQSLEGLFDYMMLSTYDTYEDSKFIIEDIFDSLLPYIGLEEEDFFPVEVGENFYTLKQKLNGRSIDDYGYIKMEVTDQAVLLSVYTLSNAKAPKDPSLTADAAYANYKKMAQPDDIVPQSEATINLTYYVLPSDIDYKIQKPTELSLVWNIKGKNNTYRIDAMTGKQIGRVE